MIKFKVKVGDSALVIAGQFRGKIGKILQIIRKESSVRLDGIGVFSKKSKGKEPVTKNRKIHISNIKKVNE